MGFKIPAINATRWNSQLSQIKMFNKALQKHLAVQDKISCFRKHGKITTREQKILKEIELILSPFKDATDSYQKEHESIGEVIPGYHHMLNTMADFLKPAGKVIYCKDFVKTIQQSLKKRLGYGTKDATYILGMSPFLNKIIINFSNFSRCLTAYDVSTSQQASKRFKIRCNPVYRDAGIPIHTTRRPSVKCNGTCPGLC